ncbi:dTDP-4-dehydrorhamnose reductase [Rudaea cellulosilytica]|uniref:dTDP-4-dehydrorhamnose reductase n=1 Tax=Rudaea cellulosilytica TaxID=540746 RepID=UPI00035DF419|nr:dTDP-4-dehydrorhamnose reductase [Rudaea cellulosilytica]
MKILLLGANGQVGFELQRSLSPLGEVSATTRSGKLPGNVDGLRADLADAGSLAQALQSERWDIVVNAAAYTAVDRAEDEAALAQRINGEALAQIGQWAARNAALVVHYSTDYVFDGQGARPYSEDDATAPLGVYGRSKLAGEEALRESGCAHLILRTAWVYGARGGNFLRTMLRLARERDRLTVVDDQRGAPTSSRLIAATTAMILKQWRDGDATRRGDYNGIHHLAAGGETTWCGFARAIVTRAAVAGLIAREVEVAAIRTADFPTKARRPAYSVLDTSKLRERFDLEMPEWTRGLDAVIGELAEASGGK